MLNASRAARTRLSEHILLIPSPIGMRIVNGVHSDALLRLLGAAKRRRSFVTLIYDP